MAKPEDCSVLIAGAGPTRLTLARRGVLFRIVDKAETYFAGSRGKGLQPRSLELLDKLGVIDERGIWTRSSARHQNEVRAYTILESATFHTETAILDTDGHARRGYDVEPGSLVLIRADGYLGVIADRASNASVGDYLSFVTDV